MSILTDRLSSINEALARKIQARNEYDRTISETEAAYMKILESSQTLLQGNYLYFSYYIININITIIYST